MNDTITIEAGEHAAFTTIRTDELDAMKAELADSRENFMALGEVFEGAKEHAAVLEGELTTATALIATLRETLRDVEQSRAIQRRALDAVRDQLKDANEQISDLHTALSKARQGVNPL